MIHSPQISPTRKTPRPFVQIMLLLSTSLASTFFIRYHRILVCCLSSFRLLQSPSGSLFRLCAVMFLVGLISVFSYVAIIKHFLLFFLLSMFTVHTTYEKCSFFNLENNSTGKMVMVACLFRDHDDDMMNIQPMTEKEQT